MASCLTHNHRLGPGWLRVMDGAKPGGLFTGEVVSGWEMEEDGGWGVTSVSPLYPVQETPAQLQPQTEQRWSWEVI